MIALLDRLKTALLADTPFVTLARSEVEEVVRELESMSTARIRELEGK